MLSAALQSSTNTTRANTAENSAAPAANNPTANAGVNDLQQKNIGTEQQADLFAGQLSDAFVSTQAATELISAELVATEGEQIALQNPEQAGFEHQGQQEQEQPDAEAWLQAMLNQQQLQLQTRDTAAVTTPTVTAANTALTSPANSVDATSAARQVSATVVEKNTTTNSAISNAVVLVPGIGLNPQTSSSVSTGKTPASEKIFDSVANTTTNPTAMTTTAHAGSASDARVVDSANTAIASTSMAMSSSATNVVQLASVAINEMSASETISSSIVPAALTSAGAESAQRTAQSQLSLHAPEAKWGEQLLHALRDNVQVQIQQKIQNATIRLDPPELGSLEIYLSHESGRLQVQITASQADVARLIQHTSDRLRQELSGPQFTQVNIQTSAEGQSGQQQSRERQRFNGDELILANEQAFVGDEQHSKRPGDVLVTV
jgi:flagellar hook-length control protein FliK